MSLTSTTCDLYGGAMTVSLPTDLVDASNLRQIPDHQEVFLRKNALTSIIFEINEYQTSDHITTATPTTGTQISTSTTASTHTQDEAAATHHLIDIIQPPDSLASSSLKTMAITITQSSLNKFPAYHTTATIITPEVDLRAAHQSALPVTWQSNPVQREYETKTQQLLVRMKDYGVDFCVRVDVPLKEFVDDVEGGEKEVKWAEEVMRRIVETVDVKNFGLFGEE
ncbi:hypothetical protein H2198_003140 [Neophaeococcomyces mojaviensis]|uniref:Uncharacterized protein n=1 Tax=Neophaeococcomyces mojaviensis TaxID=3383035 RepID=A0ACC3AC79_9EURO|nr:hypothetical protein H2198_003140 [Knufia sp. JES_112]